MYSSVSGYDAQIRKGARERNDFRNADELMRRVTESRVESTQDAFISSLFAAARKTPGAKKRETAAGRRAGR